MTSDIETARNVMRKTDFDVDLLVIGGGSGGVRAARIAAGHGAKVMLAEEFRMGGTCVVRGCVPKKLFVYASRFASLFERAPDFGWDALEPPSFEWPNLVGAVANEVSRLERLYLQSQLDAGVEVVMSRAELVDAHTVCLVASGRLVTAKTILIATGGRPERPTSEQTQFGVTSNEIFQLETFPEKLVIAGAGYIAIEFASVFASLGSDVTIICRGDNVLRGFDDDIRKTVAAEFLKRGIKMCFNDTIVGVESETATGSRTLAVATKNGGRLMADEVLWAFGRSPNTRGLGLDKAGVATTAEGAVVVDENSRSSVPNIYAVGDVTNRVNLTPIAIREGHAFADSVFGDKPWRVDYSVVPTAVFCTPEVGCVGMTEKEAKAQRQDLKVEYLSFDELEHELGPNDGPRLFKILVDAHDRVVAVHIFGGRSGELIQTLAVAINAKATRDAFVDVLAAQFGLAMPSPFVAG